MARPAKAIATASGARTKEEIAFREGLETRIKGPGGKPKPPAYLNAKQKKIFRFIVDGLVAADIVSNMDEFVIANTAVAVDRLREIETMVNSDMTLLFDNKLMGTRSKYESTLWRGCNELCLSPQARAKIGSLAMAKRKDEQDPLLTILGGDTDE